MQREFRGGLILLSEGNEIMKVKATKLANGKLQLEISDNSNGKVIMKFGDVNQMAELGEQINEEVVRIRNMENHLSSQQQLFNFR